LFIDYPFGLESRIVPLFSRRLQALQATSTKYLSRKSIGRRSCGSGLAAQTAFTNP
jgi:hypothetical protein